MPKKRKSLQFDSELIRKAEELAKADRRSFNSWLACLIEKAVRESQIKTPSNS